VHYHDLLAAAHGAVTPEWYFEIGTRSGTSLALARCASIAIDPDFRLKGNVLGSKPALHLFQETSDAAFANPRLKALAARIDFAFLDGLHHFEFLLRDLINTESMMSEDGVMFLHDVAPRNVAMTTREIPDVASNIAWTGDVWKLMPILARFRPELEAVVLDCRPTGLAMITGPWCQSDALTRHYDEIVAEWVTLDLGTYGIARYYDEHPMVETDILLAHLNTTTASLASG
jgi:hypothetical protein